ncbi:glycosyltransferase [Hyphomicrobium sp. NDB2Meth4]|uniref:glycosyltransferase n=1 Tax=Hyphomicrobium sp. NDB2Meth4 TaxID=1892846 RepID=UPI0009300223|nr:glycosyltransferase [Hyphomicrobium sp. NDB2Meth4]
MPVASGMTYWEAVLPGLVLGLLAAGLLPWLNRSNTLVRTIAITVGLALAWRYMTWRITSTLPPIGLTWDFAFGAGFTLIELLSMIGASIAMLFLTRTINRTPQAEANLPWLTSLPEPPLVDVLICTYNEEKAILERTIIGALGLDYPRYRLWVCDDGRREWLKQLCEQHSCGYITRPDNRHAKAGNINNALLHLSELAEQPDFIAILDADFVPKAQFLNRTLALTRDDDIGVVQTPQHFFNPDPIQNNLSLARVWPDEQRFFFDVVMASKDAWGGAFCCGTSSILRFEPLMRIGGFPTDSVTEDYLVSLRLSEIGYRTIYLNEPLSLGLAPEGLKEYVSQRSRWALGFMQICRGPSGPFSTSVSTPFIQRLMLVDTFLHWSATHAFRLSALVIPAVYLLFNIQAVYAAVPDAVSHLFPFLVVQTAVIAWLTKGRVLPIMNDLSQLLVANDIAKSVLVGLFKPQGHKFEVTAKGGDRSKGFVQWKMLRMFLAYLIITVGGVIWAFGFDDSRSLTDASAIALFWSWYNIVILTLACFVCFETSQQRQGDRFSGSGWAMVLAGADKAMLPIADISVSGMRLYGTAPGAVGSDVEIAFDGIEVQAKVARIDVGDFAVEFAPSQEMHARLVRHIYGGGYGTSSVDIEPAKVASAILNRVLR